MANPMAMRWCRLYKGTPAELALEDAVARLGVPYRTQFPLFLYGARYFPDFVLPSLALVIEVDDPSHNRGDKKLEDEERTAEIKAKFGWTVVRVTNDAAIADPDEAVSSALSAAGISLLVVRKMGKSPKIANSLPRCRSAPQAASREAKAQARRAARSTPRQRSASSN